MRKLTEFDIDYAAEVMVPATTGVGIELSILTPDIETNSEHEFEVNDTRKDRVERINLTDLDIVVRTPDGEDFSFLESIDIYLSAPGIEERRVAWKHDIPDDAGSVLILNTTTSDLQDYIKADKFKLRVRQTTDELISQDYYLDVNAVFNVDARVAGL